MHPAFHGKLWLAGLLIMPLLGQAKPPEDQWFTVLLDGRKIGSFESSRQIRGSVVVTMQKLDLTLDRAGSRVALRSAETSTETIDGKARAFRSISLLSGSETAIEGRVRDGSVQVTVRNGGAIHHRSMNWPDGALLPEGLRLAGLRAGLDPGTRYRALSFQPSSLDAGEVTSVVQAPEAVDLPGGSKLLHPVEQTLVFSGTPVHSHLWVDGQQTAYKLTMPVMGVELTLLACDRACANAPNQASDVFERTLMHSPRPLAPSELAGNVQYTLAPRDGDASLTLPTTDEQHVVAEGADRIVTIRPIATIGGEAGPTPDAYLSNDWLQSTAPEVMRIAQRAIGDATKPRERMQRIETFVRSYIRNKNLDVGYASALEVARKPEGDCTEHAVLVAALGRALGIATHVVNGLAYVPGFAGNDQIFVPHAWAQAWIDGRWQSFDAALAGFDAGHIALAIGDGDPWRFYAGLDMLGRIDLRKVEPFTEPIP